MKNLKISKNVDDLTRNDIIQFFQKYWDCFCKKGARQTILGHEFGIDTGDSKPLCCKKPAYNAYESKIIMDTIQQLLANGWAKLCKGPWGSLIVIAPKPQQELVSNIDDFIWKMCVSYRKLNGFTKTFQYPIPQCNDAVTVLNVGENRIWIITFDACQGYHQVAVRPIYQGKLALFAPDNNKYCFGVMPFVPTNVCTFNSAMMKKNKYEWDRLFIIWVKSLSYIDREPVHVTDSFDIFVG